MRKFNFILFFLALALVTTPELFAKDIKTAKPESVGISSKRLARMDKFMQEQIDNKKSLFFLSKE